MGGSCPLILENLTYAPSLLNFITITFYFPYINRPLKMVDALSNIGGGAKLLHQFKSIVDFFCLQTKSLFSTQHLG